MKNKKIVLCKIDSIHRNYITVKYMNVRYDIQASQISDYPVDLNEYFVIGKSYRFCLMNNKYLSYKAVRPKLLKNKKYPMPTISGWKNLERELLKNIGHEVPEIIYKKKPTDWSKFRGKEILNNNVSRNNKYLNSTRKYRTNKEGIDEIENKFSSEMVVPIKKTKIVRIEKVEEPIVEEIVEKPKRKTTTKKASTETKKTTTKKVTTKKSEAKPKKETAKKITKKAATKKSEAKPKKETAKKTTKTTRAKKSN